MCFLFSMKKLTHLKSAQTQVQLQIQVQAQHMDLRREAHYTSPISRTWSLWSTKHPCSRLQMDSYRSCALRHLYARASVGSSRSSSGRFCHALFRSHSRCIRCLGLGRSLIPGNTQRHMVQRVKLEKRKDFINMVSSESSRKIPTWEQRRHEHPDPLHFTKKSGSLKFSLYVDFHMSSPTSLWALSQPTDSVKACRNEYLGWQGQQIEESSLNSEQAL